MFSFLESSFRGILLITTFCIGASIAYIFFNSKEKADYEISTGTIQYLDKKYKDLPNRDHGKYRYLKLSSYPYVFEIYEPNSEKTKYTIDDLKVGNEISIYYYETGNTREEQINRFAQFIDFKDEAYFVRSGFQMQLGFVLIVICLLTNLMAYFFWRRGKLSW